MRTFFVWIGRAFSFSTSSSSLTWLTAATNIRNGLKSSASWSAYRRCCGYRATSSTTSPPTGISVSDTWVRKTQKHQEDSVERPHQTADFHFCLLGFCFGNHCRCWPKARLRRWNRAPERRRCRRTSRWRSRKTVFWNCSCWGRGAPKRRSLCPPHPKSTSMFRVSNATGTILFVFTNI